MHLTTLSRTFRSDDSPKTFSRPYSNSNYSSMQIAFFLRSISSGRSFHVVNSQQFVDIEDNFEF